MKRGCEGWAGVHSQCWWLCGCCPGGGGVRHRWPSQLQLSKQRTELSDAAAQDQALHAASVEGARAGPLAHFSSRRKWRRCRADLLFCFLWTVALPAVDNNLFCFSYIQGEIVILAPRGQLVHFPPSGWCCRSVHSRGSAGWTAGGWARPGKQVPPSQISF